VRYRFEEIGRFYTPGQVAHQLVQIAGKAGFPHLRVSGGEPTIGSAHLIALLKDLNEFPYNFILETNGMLLSDEGYVESLSKFDKLHVRISLKAATPGIFSKVTGASGDAFNYPLRALQLLVKHGISCHAAVVRDFCSEADLQFLSKHLGKISSSLGRSLELESLTLYPHVRKGLKKVGFSSRT
jgi:uncharacterized Fe-S cluster-containing radical SAM superfamily protein